MNKGKKHPLHVAFLIKAILVLALFCNQYAAAQTKVLKTFTNPILPAGADPWIT